MAVAMVEITELEPAVEVAPPAPTVIVYAIPEDKLVVEVKKPPPPPPPPF
jgi:hypothetical protein